MGSGNRGADLGLPELRSPNLEGRLSRGGMK